jgi:L-ascorbate metabolism protein UlaG (beta-lactamase superfamily)
MKFIRHATCWFTYGEKNVILDPFFMPVGSVPPIPGVESKERNPLKPLPLNPESLPPMDLILVTHPHFDHFDKFAANVLSKKARLIIPPAGKKKARRFGFKNLDVIQPNETKQWENLKISAVSTRPAERFPRWLSGNGVGYIIENSIAKKNKTIYISGDTILFEGLLRELEKYRIDCAILYGGGARLPIFGRHTFSNAEIISLVNRLKPEQTFVVHQETLNHCVEPAMQLINLIQATNVRTHLRPLIPGETVEIES